MTQPLDYFEVAEPIVIPMVNADGAGDPNTVSWTEITGKPTQFPPSSHIHAQEDVTGLVTEINTLHNDISEIDSDFDFATNIESFLTPGL